MTFFNRLSAEPVYNTRAVVQRTGVPADTFRAWERRYGIPSPHRTAGNQRLYSERDIATIAWLRDQTRSGLTISQAVARLRSTGAADVPVIVEPAVPLPHAGASLAPFCREIVDALGAFDAAAADRVVEEAIALVPVEDLCLHVLQPALIEIGERWAHGAVGVGAEHFATNFVMRKLGALFNLSEPERGRGPLLAACPEGELHETGLLLTALFLSRHGYRVVYLGANLPLADLGEAARRVRPALVLLSAATPLGAERLIEAARGLGGLLAHGPLGPSPGIGYGGRIFVDDPELRERVAGSYLGQDAAEAVVAVDRMLGTPR